MHLLDQGARKKPVLGSSLMTREPQKVMEGMQEHGGELRVVSGLKPPACSPK